MAAWTISVESPPASRAEAYRVGQHDQPSLPADLVADLLQGSAEA